MYLSDAFAVHPLVARLHVSGGLTDQHVAALSAVSCETASYPAGHQIFRAGDRPGRGLLLLEGFVSNSKVVENGKRQIMSLHIPGDLPVQMMHPDWALDVDISAVSACKLACFDPGEIWAVCQEHPQISWALWECALITASIHREWIVNVGHRPAVSRLAHLFCETMTRLEAAGLARDDGCDLPLTHVQLSDATGLSRVQVTRSMKELRQRDLIKFENGRLTIRDRKGLAEVGGFRPDYLYIAPSRIVAQPQG
ncbi:MAG: Crp/Fnr family transcriptional regulator [Pseudomonadota bacterium]|nr:Crp/Fnr family transcriptional regulator [Pseudomonadota bacterium]